MGIKMKCRKDPPFIVHCHRNTAEEYNTGIRDTVHDMIQPFSPPPGDVDVTGRGGLLCLDLAENVTEKERQCYIVDIHTYDSYICNT